MITLIPARGGSKGLPGKNIRDFCGKPLLAWSILQSPFPVVVTSDDDEILAVAREYGATGIKRPPELSTDTATSEDALLHALDELGAYHEVCFLQPTSPLRRKDDVIRAATLFRITGADSLFSCCELEDFTAWEGEGDKLRGLTFDPLNRGRRQDRKPIHLENGSIYLFKTEILRRNKNRLGGKTVRYPMEYWQGFEIDDQDTWDFCEFYFKKRGLDAGS